ncbi:MAG: MarR family winged helix-turn-helix transcriptional regulator [Acidimicrobiales bacterium]
MTGRVNTTLQSHQTEPEAAARLRSAIARISRHLRPTKAGAGYTPTQISVLQTVAKQGPIRLSDLAAAEGLNPTMLSRVARKFEDPGLIRRHRHPVDRRAALLEVTPAGRKLVERIRHERTDQLSVELDGLTETEHRLVIDALPVLERLAERLKDRPR